jgi:tRNA-guanine family transglycosylase
MRSLSTSSGALLFPAFFPVTTFGGKFLLDELVRPYLKRFSPGVMASYHYAKMMTERPDGVLFIDSGGFASLFDGAKLQDVGDFAVIRTKEGDEISPPAVLAFQEKHADIGATVDFLIPPNCAEDEVERRFTLTLKNALWAIKNQANPSLVLYGSIQAWDANSATRAMHALAPHPFSGFALGGMVPRIRRPEEIIEIVRAIRAVDSKRPLHVFGIGSPRLISDLFRSGVDSVDSSSYVRAATDGKFLDVHSLEWVKADAKITDMTSCACRSCQILGRAYLALEGEANRMALTLHNLEALFRSVCLFEQSDRVT